MFPDDWKIDSLGIQVNEIRSPDGDRTKSLHDDILPAARRYPRCAWTLTSGIIGFLGKVRGGDAGIEAAGGEPEHGGGDDEEAQSSHNAAILPQVRQLGKGLE